MSVHPPLSAEGAEGRVEPPTRFSKKGGGLTGSQFDILILIGFIFFRRGCSFDIKNKLNSEIFNDKKVYKRKCFSLSSL